MTIMSTVQQHAMSAAIDVSLVVIAALMIVFFGFTCAYVNAHSKELFQNDSSSHTSHSCSATGRIVPYRPVYGARGPNPTNDVIANIPVNRSER